MWLRKLKQYADGGDDLEDVLLRSPENVYRSVYPGGKHDCCGKTYENTRRCSDCKGACKAADVFLPA